MPMILHCLTVFLERRMCDLELYVLLGCTILGTTMPQRGRDFGIGRDPRQRQHGGRRLTAAIYIILCHQFHQRDLASLVFRRGSIVSFSTILCLSINTTNMREIVHLQAGQCGNQIGSKFWQVGLCFSCRYKTLRLRSIS